VLAGLILLCAYGDEEGEEYHAMFNQSLYPALNLTVVRRHATAVNRKEATKVREFFGPRESANGQVEVPVAEE
jgi:hypothetical protein